MNIQNENYKRIRTPRKVTRFYIDNEILEQYAKILKPHGIAVYAVLAKFANSKTQSCFPSYETIMKSSGIGRRNTVARYLKLLESLGLIVIKSSKGRTSNDYILLAVGIEKNNSSGNAQEQYPKRQSNSSYRDTLSPRIKSNKEIILSKERTDTGAQHIRSLLEKYRPEGLKQKKKQT